MATLTITHDPDAGFDHMAGGREAMPEDMAAIALASEYTPAGMPVVWWGPDNQVTAFTHDPELAADAADRLSRRDLQEPYAKATEGRVTVSGPHEVVLVGGLDDDIDFRPVADGDTYALLVCIVAPDWGAR